MYYVGKGNVSDGLFKMNVFTMVPNISKTKVSSFTYILELSNLWHYRLGYANFNSICKVINLCLLLTMHFNTTANTRFV